MIPFRSVREHTAALAERTPTNDDFLKLLVGRLLTNIGDSLYTVAAMWLVFELTTSTLFTGLAGFLTRLPPALQFLTGPVVDRYSTRAILVWTQVVQGTVVLVVPLAALLGGLSVWVVLTVIPALSLINQFMYPAQNSALPRVVEKDLLARANSLFDVAYRGSNILFNAVAGGVIAAVGAVSVYLIDSVTFAIAAFVFVTLGLPTSRPSGDEGAGGKHGDGPEGRVKASSIRASTRKYLEELREGVDVVRNSLVVHIAIVAIVTNLAIGMMRGVLPAFAALRGGAGLYGSILAGLGGGQLVGSAAVSVSDDVRFGRVTVAGFGLSSVVWFLSVGFDHPLVLIGALGFAYIPVGVFNVVMFAAVQAGTPEDLVGRTTSLLVSFGTVSLPLGMAIGGVLGEAVGTTNTVRATSLGFAFVAIYFGLRPKLRALPAVGELDATHLEL